MKNYDNIIWIMLIFVFFIIMGLYISEYTPLNLNERKKAIDLSYITENFSPSSSSTTEQTEGASQLYNWGLPDDKIVVNTDSTTQPECKHTPPHIYGCPPEPVHTCIENPPKADCNKCDITSNKDIDKYILKSSIPPCPDMSEFITKNMMNANPDLSEYILKSEIKPCEKVDTSQYILKSQIPACPTCPVCPECPICPVCPPQQPQEKCKQIFEYNIREHPDIANYLSMEDVAKNFIPKDQVLNSDIVKNHIKEKCNTSSQSVQPPLPRKQAPPQEETKYKKFIDKIYEEAVPPKDVMGYYAGDSLFAGV
jgi:hypothetical protein